MANLQYIGARYVPKFYMNPDDQSNNWKQDNFEALTIVTFNNDSYTSKIFVPDTIGDPASNPQYWACTTKYTAALMALQTTVQNLEDFAGDLPLSTVSQTLAGGINEIFDNLPYITPEMFGAKGDDITDDILAINAASLAAKNSNKKLIFAAKTYVVSMPIDVYSDVSYVGAGRGQTVIKAKPSSNTDIFKTQYFDELTGTNAGTITTNDKPARNFEIRNLTIDGNYLQLDGTVTNTAGVGLKIYGLKYVIDNVTINNCAGIGFYTEYAGTHLSDPYGYYDWHDSYISCEINGCGEEGMIFRGPSDIVIKSLYCGSCCWSGYSTTYSSNTPSAVVFEYENGYEGSCEIEFAHVFGNKYGYSIETKGTVRFKAAQLILESSAGGLLLNNNAYSQIDTLDCHTMYPSTSFFYIDVESGSGTLISNLLIRKAADASNRTCVKINGNHVNIGTGMIDGYATAGNGIEINQSFHNIHLDITRFTSGSCAILLCNRSMLDLVVSNAATLIDNTAIGTYNDVKVNCLASSGQTLISDKNITNKNKYQINGSVAGNEVQFPCVLLGYQLLDLTSVSLQTIDADISKCAMTPPVENIIVAICNNYDQHGFTLDYIAPVSVSGNTLTIKAKIGTASPSATRNANLSISLN